mgnify:CR=1 FL=1
MRGLDGPSHGIIPANTGRMGYPEAGSSTTRDHPREYGENFERDITNAGLGGSSPRIRGEYHGHAASYALLGIIPANTGRMSHTYALFGSAWDHPREYGENPDTHASPDTSAGSSPRIRGEWRVERNGYCGPRDHPREYGENRGPHVFRSTIDGSSPRIRGECESMGGGAARRGIIPANTGRMS